MGSLVGCRDGYALGAGPQEPEGNRHRPDPCAIPQIRHLGKLDPRGETVNGLGEQALRVGVAQVEIPGDLGVQQFALVRGQTLGQ